MVKSSGDRLVSELGLKSMAVLCEIRLYDESKTFDVRTTLRSRGS